MRPSRLMIFSSALAIAALAGCDSERAIATNPVGAPAYGIRLNSSGSNLPRGTVTYFVRSGMRDSIQLQLQGLDSLAGTARYTLWVRDSAGTGFQRFAARITMTTVDTAVNAQGDPFEVRTTTTFANTSSFSNGGPNRTFRIDGPTPAGFAAGARPGLVLLTIEESAMATAPNPFRRPLWATRTAFTAPTATTVANAGQVRFGFWSVSPDSLYEYPVGPQRGRALFRGNVLFVNDSSLPRPPRGYFYATYLVKRDDNNQPIDTIYLGPQTAPPPRRDISLRDADSVIVDPTIQTPGFTNIRSPQIIAAAARASADTVAGIDVNVPFRGVADVLVTLELKNYKVDEARLGPAIVLRADVPTIVRNGPRSQ